jgi:hypothetical protein
MTPSAGDTFLVSDGATVSRLTIDEISDEHPTHEDPMIELFSVGVRASGEFTYYDIFYSDEIGEWLQDGLDPEDVEGLDVD